MITPLVFLVLENRKQFSNEFVEWISNNEHIWEGFANEALSIIDVGFKHYSARTIVHVLRHHSALSERGSGWKINDHCSPYLARLFALKYPEHASFFEKRKTKTADQDNWAAKHNYALKL